MPGHIKLGTSGEPDPNPLPYLEVTPEMKRQDMLKPYDAKKSSWCPDGKGGYMECMLDSVADGKATVFCGHEKKVFKDTEVAQVNPPKFEKCEDMVNLTYLNDASVYHNLVARYKAKMIYTYSGLFCVVVNPYKRYPIYTPTVVKMYLGKRKNEVPPHLWAISETAYRNMMQNKKDQSMLITGESGAGKTENTKKVISYLAMVATSKKKDDGKKASLEDRIVATNPILESYGNAKTSRNDNSSRFGKFIRIHFNASGKLAGCDIESYLLEKSRITQQQEVERSYHIFYQLLMPYVSDLKQKCLLSDDIYDYSYVSQGKVTVASIDDNEELEFTDQAFEIIGFTETEKWDCFKITSAVMSCGEIRFKQKGRDDQAEPDDMSFPNKVATLLGVQGDELMKSFCKPKIKVGTEWVTKGQNIEQATNGVGGIARSTYERLFKWLIIKCNETLIDKTMKKVNFVAVLDIAGFEIFEYNGFEQICINFVNEKLQQFFNHHMFVVEQQEYISEGIDWAMVDFGMDLLACITMFEKPMGIWAILEEESLFPKATDKSFEEKLKAQHLGKSPTFAKPQSKSDKNAHFAIIHYAGIVSYNITAWLEKNKDPVNDTVVDRLKSSSNELLVLLWADHPGQSSPPDDSKKKKKKGGSKTVSSVYLLQLNDLMNTLHSTEPHFIRCIVPNNFKKPLEAEAPLILHQLTCNGVLEGIRICMKGFPNRMPYQDFKSRYQILGSAELRNAKDNKVGVSNLMDKIKFDKERYRLGHTKVFFRAGALAAMEEARDQIVIKLLRWFQGQCYAYIKGKRYNVRRDQRELIQVIQRNFRKYFRLRNWGWFIIIQKTRPLIGQVNIEEELRLLEEKAKETYGAYEDQLKTKAKLQEKNDVLREEKKTLAKQLEEEQGDMSEYMEKQSQCASQKAVLEAELQDCASKLSQMEQRRHQKASHKKEVENENSSAKRAFNDLEARLQKVEMEKNNKDYIIRGLNDEIAGLDETINKLNKEKKHLGEGDSKVSEDLTAAEDKMNHLNNIKAKLESTLDDLEETAQKEKRARGDIEKQRRKLEGDLKVAQGRVVHLERTKKDLEAILIRKDKDAKDISNRLQDEQGLVGKTQKTIKEAQHRIEEMEEELEAEKQSRAKAERQRSDLARELEEIAERLTEAGGATAAQMELNKKREGEVSRMRRDLEEHHIQEEAVLSNLKRKHQDAVSEMSEQIDQLTRMKGKIEKDKGQIQMEIQDVRMAIDEMNRAKASSEKSNKQLSAQLNESIKKVDEANHHLNEYENSKKKMLAENSDLFRQLQEMENTIGMLSKLKEQMSGQLHEVKRVADDENRERMSLLGRYRNLEHELDSLKNHLGEEACEKDNITRVLENARQDAELWMFKYQNESLSKAQELECAKMKLQARLTECQNTVEQLNGKLMQLEKAKANVQAETEDMSCRCDQAHILNNNMEKKARQFERIVMEWKAKVDSINKDLGESQRECRNISSELFRVKNAYEESVLQLDEVRKENKSLSIEIKDILDQITEGGRSIHEIDKIRKRLEAEKLELQAALEEAEGALEQEENKVLRGQLELTQVQAEIDRRIAEKEEEFGCCVKTFQKALENMQNSLEAESKAKAEAMRLKKKLEADIGELEVSLEHANISNQEIHHSIKQYQQQIREAQSLLEEEYRTKDVVKEQLIAAQHRESSLKNALEESKSLLEQVDKARRNLEEELSDANEQLSCLTCQNQALTGAKQKLDIEMHNLHAEADEMVHEASVSEEKAKRAMLDAARLADELRREQEVSSVQERDRKLLECQCKDLQLRLDEAETNALKSGKKAVNKMETRIRELSSELDAENRRMTDTQRSLRGSERRIKELVHAGEENRKNHERMQMHIDQLQSKVRMFKKQIEEAEEIAALNLAKFRQAQTNLMECEGRADLNEQALAKLRARSRSASLAP